MTLNKTWSYNIISLFSEDFQQGVVTYGLEMLLSTDVADHKNNILTTLGK